MGRNLLLGWKQHHNFGNAWKNKFYQYKGERTPTEGLFVCSKKGLLNPDEYVCCENLAAINEPIAHIDKVFETCKGSWPNPLISHLIGSSYLFKVLEVMSRL